ncbi:hypothetical protein C8R43DRAFT_899208 [Mycena crocata]|nr:hypothetical protein C8R43DRAFT_899208 [Mycena crocata]
MASFQPSAFLNYSTPHHSTRYSSTFFANLTFQQASALVLPTIHEPKSVSAWTFTNEISTGHTLEITPNEAIPNAIDLQPILCKIEEAFLKGARSVAVSLTVAGKQVDELYHFSKICLFTNLNNNRDAVQWKKNLIFDYIAPPFFLERFLTRPIRSSICGFHVTAFPLWKPSCLLGEEWLHEDVLNALAELLYFSRRDFEFQNPTLPHFFHRLSSRSGRKPLEPGFPNNMTVFGGVSLENRVPQ